MALDSNQYEAMTWDFSKESNATRSTCRTFIDVAFLTSYIVTGIAIFIGNLFTCAVFLSKHHLRRTYMNAFLISLACSDFLMAILVLPGFTIFCTHCPALPFSLSPKSKACRVLDGLKDFVFLATVFNVLAITFDRYQAVLQSLRYRSRINKKTVTLILALVWFVPWPIAYLKHILTLIDPLILKGKNSSFIYDNVVVFTCIISPMVVLLVVNSLLTREIRVQQAKISVPRNLHLTQQQMEERERKNENEDATETTDKTRVEENGVREDDNRENSCDNHVNEGFQGDEEDGNNEINIEEFNEHVIEESRENHVNRPINLTKASISRDDGNIKATQINEANNGNQGNGKRDEKNFNLEELKECHVICSTCDDHVTVYGNDLCRKTLGNNNFGPDTFKAKFNSKNLIVDANESEISHGVEIRKDCVCRLDVCVIQRKRPEDDNAKGEETAGKAVQLKSLKSCQRRKMGCVIQQGRNELANERFQELQPSNNDPILEARNTDSLKQAKHDEEDPRMRTRSGSDSIPSHCLRRRNSLQDTVHQSIELHGSKATRRDQHGKYAHGATELQNNQSSPSFADSEPCFTKRSELREANVPSCYQNGTFSETYRVKIKSQNKSYKILEKINSQPDDGVAKAISINEDKQTYGESSCSRFLTTERESPGKDSDIKKNITFQEQKKSVAKPTESSLIRKQLRKFSRDRKDRNGTRSCLTVALIFVICWIPRCLYNFLMLFARPSIIDMYLLEKISMLFLFMQSLTNPLVYCFYRSDFRQTAKELIRKIIRCGQGNC